MQLELIEHNIEELFSLAKSLTDELKAGDVILLNGDLGSGKSEFVRRCGISLGVNENLESPTFCFENTYMTNAGFRLNHFDLYRLASASELEVIGFYEDGYEPKCAVAFIEWADLFPDEMPEYALSLQFSGSFDNPRTIVANGTSKRATKLMEALERCEVL